MTVLKNPYKRRLDRAAWEEGRVAREERRPREAPHDDSAPALLRAWLRGWDECAAVILAEHKARRVHAEHQRPPVCHQLPPIVQRGGRVVELVVPDDEDLGPRMVYIRPRPVPCPECRRLRLDTLSPACVMASGPRRSEDGETQVAYMRCRCCQHRFSVPVKG